MKVSDIIKVTDLTVRCEGGQGAEGHPVVYLNLEKTGEVVCPYCSRKYVLARDGARH